MQNGVSIVMNYEEQKSLVIRKREELFKKYNQFYNETIRLAALVAELCDLPQNVNQQADLMYFITGDEDSRKLTRLLSAIQYVEKPNDRVIVDALKENIDINRQK